MTPIDDKARAEMQAQYRFLVINLCRITGLYSCPKDGKVSLVYEAVLERGYA
jgi:hypothetical protein